MPGYLLTLARINAVKGFMIEELSLNSNFPTKLSLFSLKKVVQYPSFLRYGNATYEFIHHIGECSIEMELGPRVACGVFASALPCRHRQSQRTAWVGQFAVHVRVEIVEGEDSFFQPFVGFLAGYEILFVSEVIHFVLELVLVDVETVLNDFFGKLQVFQDRYQTPVILSPGKHFV